MKVLPLFLLLTGCAHYSYQQPNQVSDFTQTSHDVVQVNNSLAELISSSYPMVYSIGYMFKH